MSCPPPYQPPITSHKHSSWTWPRFHIGCVFTQGLSVLDMATGSSCCLYMIQQHLKTSLQGLTCISTPSSFCPLSLSRFLFLFLFHLWPLNLLRFRAFFHWQPTSPTTHCLYLVQQWPKSSLVFDAAAFMLSNHYCIWYSNLPSSHLALLQNVLCLWLCQFVFRPVLSPSSMS